MPRDRDYEEEYRRSNEIAMDLGYENAYQRRQIHGAESAEELKSLLEPQVQQLAAEGDYQAMGRLYADVYDGYEFMDIDFEDLWADMEY
jgi:hypothetical protein